MDRPQPSTAPAYRSASLWKQWWDGVPPRIAVVGFDPQGQPLSLYPQMLTVPTEVWVTSEGFTVDDWKFFGWTLHVPENQARLGEWALSWSREGEDVEKILTGWIDELELRLKNNGNDGCARTSLFLLTPRTDLDLPLSKGGWVQEDFPF